MDPVLADRKIKDERSFVSLYPPGYINDEKKRLEVEAARMVIGIVTRCQKESGTTESSLGFAEYGQS